jgi:putative FmdB family regulatory protein
MPLFEYLCESCGRTFEAIQSHSEAPLTTCDRCGGPLRKLLSAPAFQFKGSGWYVSDYGRPGGESGNAGEGSKKDEGAKTGEGSKMDEGPKKGKGSKKDGGASKEGATAGGSAAPPSGKDV